MRRHQHAGHREQEMMTEKQIQNKHFVKSVKPDWFCSSSRPHKSLLHPSLCPGNQNQSDDFWEEGGQEGSVDMPTSIPLIFSSSPHQKIKHFFQHYPRRVLWNLCNQGHTVRFLKRGSGEITLKMIKRTGGGFRGCVHLAGKIIDSVEAF